MRARVRAQVDCAPGTYFSATITLRLSRDAGRPQMVVRCFVTAK